MSSIVLARCRTSILPNDHESQPTQHWLKGWAGPRTATRTDPAQARTKRRASNELQKEVFGATILLPTRHSASSAVAVGD
jgi:hypothetical protein